jgi:DNA repair exonuclease SbcCD nuclease subunit
MIFVGDLHLDLYHNYGMRSDGAMSNRLWDMRKNLMYCVQLAVEYGGHIILTGDIFESRVKVPSVCLQVFGDFLNLAASKKKRVYICQGNHDQESAIVSSLNAFDRGNCIVVTEPRVLEIGEDTVAFVPYRESTQEIRSNIRSVMGFKPTYLVGHLGLGDVELQRGFCEEDKILSSELDQYSGTQVVLGHYHCFNQVSKNIRFIGTPVAQTFTEADMPHYIGIGDGGSFELMEVDWVKQLKTFDITHESQLDSISSPKEAYIKLRVQPGVTVPKLPHVVRVEYSRSESASVEISDRFDALSSKEDLVAEYIENCQHGRKKTMYNLAMEIMRGG